MTRPQGLLLALVLAVPACGPGHNKQAVEGTVTWKNQPLETGMIRFFPAGGEKTEAGAVIQQGRFSVPRNDGLEPGTYKVLISSPDPKSQQGPPDALPGDRGGYPAKERIPAAYNAATKLTVQVKAGGENKFDFPIE